MRRTEGVFMLTVLGMLLSIPVQAQESDRHQFYYGYGVLSRAWLAEKLGDVFLNSFGIKSSANSQGVQQLAYNYTVSHGWMLHLAHTHEPFTHGEAMSANLVGIRKEYRHDDQWAVYWGVATGKATYSYSGSSPANHYTALQLDLGVRISQGPWFAYGNVGMGEAGGLGVGVGASF